MAVISDTHLPRGGRRLPDVCVEQLRSADLILHAGDVVSEEVLEELEGLGPPVHAVHGNMDERALCERLPETRVVEVSGVRIGMTHDAGPRPGREKRLARRFPGCAAVVYGHTHEPQVARVGEVWILNPGSPTERRRAPSHTMLVLKVNDERIEPQLVTLS
ncbi:MAG TPA: metallophosphoesterase family protein [Gaiellaceae bacterium]|nr:metallophosphoesterase family protein [Gaiellaceae bacterium]